jgi:N4-gp56 family major capsid protein
MAYTPASTTTASPLSHLATVYYDRKGLSTLRKHTHLWRLGRQDDLPLQNGKTLQWFTPTEFGANTTPTTEGSVGTGLTMSSSTISASVAQYADHISLSDFLVETDIVSSVDMATDRLSYRGALSVDNINRTELDAGGTSQALLGDVLSVSDFARARFELTGLDVDGMQGEYFKSVSHPYVLYDMLNDPQAGGYQDLAKYGLVENKEKTVPMQGMIAQVKNCQIWESSNTTQTAGVPNKWRTYIAGKDSFGVVRLSGKGPKFISNPDNERFNVYVVRNTGDQIADPERKIAAAVAYNVKWVAKTLNSTRLRYIDSPSSIVA